MFGIFEMCRKQVAAIILPLVLASLAGYSSEALSTFGVSNTKPPSAAPTTPPELLKKMWQGNRKRGIFLPIFVSFWLIGQCFGAFSPSFGVVKTVSPLKTPSPTPPSARSCTRQTECAGITGTSCVRTHYDPVTRCLCGDNNPPVNGQCDSQIKALYHVCANSDECNDGLICGTPNATGSATRPHLLVNPDKTTICLCDAENGFQEKEHACSDAEILKTSLLAIFLVSCIRKVLAY